MPLEEIAEGLFRLLGRAIYEIAYEVIFEVVAHFAGFWSLRLLSLGTYPPNPTSDRQELLCKVIGILEVFVIISSAIYWIVRT